MEIISDMNELNTAGRKFVIALGAFDGIHRGHQSIIKKARELANYYDALCAVFTFSNHPLSVVAPELEPFWVYGIEERHRALASLGVEVTIEIPFTPELAKKTAADFIGLLKE